MYFKLYPSEEAALLAAGEWARDTRADWRVLPRKNWSIVNPDQVQPFDRPRLTGARLAGFTIRAVSRYVRYSASYSGTASSAFSAAWEAPQ